jgi:hypothetical protein
MSENTLYPIKVHIQNFQSIEDLEFDVLGFTCITGPTNIGKSAIMRAMSRSIKNDPVIGMVRKGSKFSVVELSSSKWNFRWEKGEREVNRYIIGDKIYDKIGQNQLPQIAAMGFGSVKIGPDNLEPWWANQYSPMFLLDRSGTQITDFISEVSNLGVIQNAVIAAARGKKHYNDIVKDRNDEITKVHTDLAKINEITRLENLSKELKSQQESIEYYENEITFLDKYLSNITFCSDQIKHLSSIRNISIPVNDFQKLMEGIKLRISYYNTLQTQILNIIPIREIKEINIPDMPHELYEFIQKASIFMKIEPLKASVAVLDDIKSLSIPNNSEIANEVTTLHSMEQFRVQIEAVNNNIRHLANLDKLKISNISETPNDLHTMTNYINEIRKAQTAVTLSETELSNIESELLILDQELSKIPVCAMCGRPRGELHIAQHKS